MPRGSSPRKPGARESAYDPWLRIALESARWSADRRAEAQARRSTALHLGEVAEAMKCSVFEVQAELKVDRTRDVRAYRRIRSL